MVSLKLFVIHISQEFHINVQFIVVLLQQISSFKLNAVRISSF